MINKLALLIDRHTQLLNEVMVISKRLEAHSIEENTINLAFEAENRQRIINLLSTLQEKIEAYIKTIKLEDTTSETLELLKGWQFSFNKVLELIEEIDQSIINNIENIKAETAKEISFLFKAKEGFKGYNLNNVKK